MKTFKEVLKKLKISEADFNKSVENLADDEVAYKQLKLIAKALNGDWVANYSNNSQRKYENIFYFDGSRFVFFSYYYWNQYASVGARLCFKNAELATYAGKQFIDIYNKLLS